MISCICQNADCGKTFPSKSERQFCSMRCYTTSPKFRAHIAKNKAAGRAKGKGPARAGDTLPCGHCGNPVYRQPGADKVHRFCNRICYRAWNAERFDKHFAQLRAMPLGGGFDEFLSQDLLPCLIEGCGWCGHNLGQHVVQTHGIRARAFKAMVGFNAGTGLVSPALSKLLRQWSRSSGFNRRGRGPTRSQLAPEGREHYEKAMALRKIS